MTFKPGDKVRTRLKADGPDVTAEVVEVFPGGQFLRLRYERREREKFVSLLAMFDTAGCDLVQGAGAQGETR